MVLAAVTVIDARTVRVLTPPGNPSTSVTVTVTTAGQAHNLSFTYTDLRLDIVAPTIFSGSPSSWLT